MMVSNNLSQHSFTEEIIRCHRETLFTNTLQNFRTVPSIVAVIRGTEDNLVKLSTGSHSGNHTSMI